jgi:hypothetical protein
VGAATASAKTDANMRVNIKIRKINEDIALYKVKNIIFAVWILSKNYQAI